MAIALIYSEKYKEHNPGWGHPERPERLKAIVDGLKRAKLWTSPNIRVVEPMPARREDIELTHDPDYVSLVERLSSAEKPIDGDTPAQKNTFEIALLAAGGSIDAGNMVMSLPKPRWWLLLLQQHRGNDRETQTRFQAKANIRPGLRRPPRQRHSGHILRGPKRALHVAASTSADVVPRDRPS